MLSGLSATAQNIISGSIFSVPSRTVPDTVKVTFTNVFTGDKYAQRTVSGIYVRQKKSGQTMIHVISMKEMWLSDLIWETCWDLLESHAFSIDLVNNSVININKADFDAVGIKRYDRKARF